MPGEKRLKSIIGFTKSGVKLIFFFFFLKYVTRSIGSNISF